MKKYTTVIVTVVLCLIVGGGLLVYWYTLRPNDTRRLSEQRAGQQSGNADQVSQTQPAPWVVPDTMQSQAEEQTEDEALSDDDAAEEGLWVKDDSLCTGNFPTDAFNKIRQRLHVRCSQVALDKVSATLFLYRDVNIYGWIIPQIVDPEPQEGLSYDCHVVLDYGDDGFGEENSVDEYFCYRSSAPIRINWDGMPQIDKLEFVYHDLNTIQFFTLKVNYWDFDLKEEYLFVIDGDRLDQVLTLSNSSQESQNLIPLTSNHSKKYPDLVLHTSVDDPDEGYSDSYKFLTYTPYNGPRYKEFTPAPGAVLRVKTDGDFTYNGFVQSLDEWFCFGMTKNEAYLKWRLESEYRDVLKTELPAGTLRYETANPSPDPQNGYEWKSVSVCYNPKSGDEHAPAIVITPQSFHENSLEGDIKIYIRDEEDRVHVSQDYDYDY